MSAGIETAAKDGLQFNYNQISDIYIDKSKLEYDSLQTAVKNVLFNFPIL